MFARVLALAVVTAGTATALVLPALLVTQEQPASPSFSAAAPMPGRMPVIHVAAPEPVAKPDPRPSQPKVEPAPVRTVTLARTAPPRRVAPRPLPQPVAPPARAVRAPAPAPTAKPAATPAPAPKPTPAPQPAPKPQPEPAPETAPEPAPQPAPVRALLNVKPAAAPEPEAAISTKPKKAKKPKKAEESHKKAEEPKKSADVATAPPVVAAPVAVPEAPVAVPLEQPQPGRGEEKHEDKDNGKDASVCDTARVPRLRPTSPLGIAFGAFHLWRRLPPAQRRQVLTAARVHGPKVAAALLARGKAARRSPRR
jgi:hypothetical protein